MANSVNRMVSKDIGPVSAYAIAVAEGFTGTREDWENYIVNASLHAQRAHEEALNAEAYVQGTRDGIPVSSDSPYYGNNAKHYSELTAADAARVENAMVHSPIENNGTWWVWNQAAGEYQDTHNPARGATFTPSVSNAGVISWTNDAGRQNPQSVDVVNLVLAALPTWTGGSY